MIRMRDVSRVYGQKTALADVTLELEAASGVTAVIGANGAGKTTFFKLLAGLLLPTSGVIEAQGKSYARWARRNVALIPAGDRSLFARNTIGENALYQGVLKGSAPKAVRDKIARFAPRLGLEDLLDRLVEGCSSGQRKKAALLGGLCTDARLLLLDEPSWGLDIAAVEELRELLTGLEEERSLLISSHDVYFVTGVARRYLFFHNGRCRKTVEGGLDADALTALFREVQQ